MVGVYHVLRVPNRILGHVARNAIVLLAVACRLRFLARIRCVAAEALRAKPAGAIRLLRHSVRIVTDPAPEPVSRGTLASALRKSFYMPRDGHTRASACLHEYRYGIEEPLARMEGTPILSSRHHPNGARKMALRTDAVAVFGSELRRIDNTCAAFQLARLHLCDVSFPGPVASLTRHAAFEKRRRAEAVLRPVYRLQKTGMARQS